MNETTNTEHADILAAFALLTERVVSIDARLADILAALKDARTNAQATTNKPTDRAESRAVASRLRFHKTLAENYGYGREFLMREARAIGGRVRANCLDSNGNPLSEASIGYYISDLCNAGLARRVRNGCFVILRETPAAIDGLRRLVDTKSHGWKPSTPETAAPATLAI